MQTSTYQDLIENKIAEWQNSLEKLEERARKAGSGSQEQFSQLLQQMNSSVESATNELRSLSDQESAQNTITIKEKILKVFNSIDQDLKSFEEKTPFML